MIYKPSDDTYLICEVIGKKLNDKNLKILEMGFGSGYVMEFLKKRGFKNITGADINKEAIKLGKEKGFPVYESDLFSNIKGKFDIIIFNPPYLPNDKKEDKNSSLATTGGKKGSEIINRFLKEVNKHLEKNGKIFLLTSTFTKGIDWRGYKKKLIGEKKLFFEKLEAWELTI